MKRAILTVAATAVVAAPLFLGCAETEPATPAATDEVATATESAAGDPEIEKELAKLPPEDRELVLAQKICPVSDEPLGSMGPPIKITVDGKSIFICCEGCREDAEKNFAKHFAKVESSTAK